MWKGLKENVMIGVDFLILGFILVIGFGYVFFGVMFLVWFFMFVSNCGWCFWE